MCKELLIDYSKYTITEDGKIFSKHYNRNLEGYIESKGEYVIAFLKCIDGKQRVFKWHRVIWCYFNGEIPQGMQINHIDENKTNNALSNLNLLTPQQNANHGTRNERIAKALSVAKTKHHIRQYNLETDETIKIWFNLTEIEKQLGYSKTLINRCCHGGYICRDKWCNITQAYGFGWQCI